MARSYSRYGSAVQSENNARPVSSQNESTTNVPSSPPTTTNGRTNYIASNTSPSSLSNGVNGPTSPNGHYAAVTPVDNGSGSYSAYTSPSSTSNISNGLLFSGSTTGWSASPSATNSSIYGQAVFLGNVPTNGITSSSPTTNNHATASTSSANPLPFIPPLAGGAISTPPLDYRHSPYRRVQLPDVTED
ncbi:hypothetical protein BDV98DRAFT_659817 [Pterulicium gracile]|uniref:Uncharacterized protein n=1 Tax=Pterulicium gracile TaxID=1884261 RepID=A0A5C3PZM3_9AGAR|nr:hypothetical protein BDV98DRAFT_659817 [Pterula gracilis]